MDLGQHLRRVLLSILLVQPSRRFKSKALPMNLLPLKMALGEVVDIMLNLKCVLPRHGDIRRPCALTSRTGVVTAKDIETNADVEVLSRPRYLQPLTTLKPAGD